MEQLAAWLEEQRGEMGLALEELWVQPLGLLHAKGKWSLKNVVKDGMNVTKQFELVWTAIIAECARMIADAGVEPPSQLDQTLAVQWALTPTALFSGAPSVTREEVVATIESPRAHNAQPGRRTPPRSYPPPCPQSSRRLLASPWRTCWHKVPIA